MAYKRGGYCIVITMYGILMPKGEKIIPLLEECGFDVICTRCKTFAGIITNSEEIPRVDIKLWNKCRDFFEKKYGKELKGPFYYQIRKDEIIC